ncbi:TPA: hypothetical protein DEW05_00795 [Candidatus Saccharibacteria bacterium]|nr:hypothetical protein [Candidatus Saccharibacteria bacterium]
MDNTHHIELKEKKRLQEITDSAITNIELFRQQAKAALKQYSKRERKLLEQLHQDTSQPYDFLDQVETQLIPLRQALNAKRTNDSFKKTLAKHTLQRTSEVQPAVDLVIDYSDNFHIETFVRNNSSLTSLHADWLKAFVTTMGIEEISSLKKHYSDAVLYRLVAANHAITIVDPNSGIVRRMLDTTGIRRERRKTIAHENSRMRKITTRRSELSQLHDGLIPMISSVDWNIMEVLALRQEYEKKLSSLSVDDVLDDKRRLELFDSVTSEFKKKHAVQSVTTSLESARQSSAGVDTLLLRIFDLSTTQKNRLLTDFKEYRGIDDEEVAITQARAQRKNNLRIR